MAESGSVDEEQMSTEQLDASYGPLRELVTESVHQQEAILERVQVSECMSWTLMILVIQLFLEMNWY